MSRPITTDAQALNLAVKIIKAEEKRAIAYRTGSNRLPEWVFSALDRKEEFESYMQHRKEQQK